MKKKNIITVTIFALITALYLSLNNQVRDIASTLTDPPTESLNPEKTLKLKIIEGLYLDVAKNLARLQVGAPILENNNFLCTDYPTIDYIFQPEGISISGERPTLIIRVPCEMASNQRQTLPIEFEIHELLASAQTPSNSHFYTFKKNWFVNLEGETWQLTEMHFYHQDRLKILKIDNYEILSVWPKGITLHNP